MKNFNFPQITEYLEPLHQVAREVVDIEARNKSYFYEYLDEDVMAAVLVFNHIMASRKIHHHHKINKPINQANEELMVYGEQLRALVEYMTGIDTQTYYSDKKKKEGNKDGEK